MSLLRGALRQYTAQYADESLETSIDTHAKCRRKMAEVEMNSMQS